MGRPPGNGGPAFRFSANEVTEMENILREHKAQVPSREILEALAEKFSASEERSGKIKVQVKQVWNWFQNRRFALRAKQTNKPPEMFSSSPPLPRFNAENNTLEAQNAVKNVPLAPRPVNSEVAAQDAGRPVSDNSSLEFEAKSARDGAWYDVASFLSHRSLETDEPDVLVRFAGFGPEEDEWVNVRKHVRPRSLPCEATECVAILPGDLILCFQEGKEQALYYDAHVVDSQRRRHDIRGCRCRFLVRYDHDQSEEIVALRKVCRRPETDYRLLQLQSMNDSGAIKQPKMNAETPHMGNTLRVYPPSEPIPKPQKAEEESLSHGNRSISAGVKIQQTVNPEIRADVALKIPAVPPGFEDVVNVAAKNSSTSSDTPEAIEVKSVETSNHEVIMPVATEVKSLETKKTEAITPLSTGVRTVETSSDEVITPVTTEVKPLETENLEAITPLATEAKTSQTKNPVASADGVVETLTLPPGFETVTSGDNRGTDTSISMEDQSPQKNNPEGSDATNNDVPAGDAVTSSIVSGDILVSPSYKSLDSEMSASVKIPIVPPGFEAVTSDDTPVAMEVENSVRRNVEVTADDPGETPTVPSTNKAVTDDANPNSKVR